MLMTWPASHGDRHGFGRGCRWTACEGKGEEGDLRLL